jgi:ribosomal protein L11 methyltransferase
LHVRNQRAGEARQHIVHDDPQWVALRVEVAAERGDAVANFLAEQGAPGVLIEEGDGGVRLEASFPAAEVERVGRLLDAYLESLATMDGAAGAPAVTRVPVPAVDWVEHARRHHRPREVGTRFLVAPPWDAPRVAGRETLVIEPGMAFGTGQHATTRGCLEAIEEALGARPIPSALDVGTGSGVLALALARLGVRRVVAIDTDRAVLAIARATFTRNHAHGIALVAAGPRALRARFDLVVANLLADTVVAEAAALGAAVAPGGQLVLSGILVEQDAAVCAAYPGWRLVATRSEDVWQTLTLEPPG